MWWRLTSDFWTFIGAGHGRWAVLWAGFLSAGVLSYGQIVHPLLKGNCHEPGCWRIGTRLTVEDNGHHFLRCKRHHDVRHQEASQ